MGWWSFQYNITYIQLWGIYICNNKTQHSITININISYKKIGESLSFCIYIIGKIRYYIHIMNELDKNYIYYIICLYKGEIL